jgi:hypothetical protein
VTKIWLLVFHCAAASGETAGTTSCGQTAPEVI